MKREDYGKGKLIVIKDFEGPNDTVIIKTRMGFISIKENPELDYININTSEFEEVIDDEGGVEIPRWFFKVLKEGKFRLERHPRKLTKEYDDGRVVVDDFIFKDLRD